MVEAAISESARFNLIGMWVEPAARGLTLQKSWRQGFEARASDSRVDNLHKPPADTAALANRVNKHGPDHVTIQACGFDNLLATLGHEGLTLVEQRSNPLRRKISLDLRDDLSRIILGI